MDLRYIDPGRHSKNETNVERAVIAEQKEISTGT